MSWQFFFSFFFLAFSLGDGCTARENLSRQKEEFFPSCVSELRRGSGDRRSGMLGDLHGPFFDEQFSERIRWDIV